MDLDTFIKIMALPGLTFLAGNISGFLFSRFTLSKAEKKTEDQKKYENSRQHKEKKEEYYVNFISAMKIYIEKEKSELKLDDFLEIAKTGDLYFNELRIIADAILGGRVDIHSRDNTFVPDIRDALSKNITAYYDTLQNAAKKLGVEYDGKFERSKYESLFKVAEKYGSRLAPVKDNFYD